MSQSILHLDDEKVIRDMLGELLRAHGYRVRSVATPGEALTAVREEIPHLIISDLQLDEADGLQSIARLREIGPSVPVLLLTGVLIDPVVARKTVGQLVTSYLEKTRPPSAIIEEIVRLIGPAK